MVRESIRELIQKQMPRQHFDSIAVGMLDWTSFSSNTFFCIEFQKGRGFSETPSLFFDLASLTKPLTLFTTYLVHPHLFGTKEILLLEHRGGLPSGGRLSKKTWREELLRYSIKESPTLYSDYSALRLMLELEKKSGKTLSELSQKGAFFWKKLLQENNLNLYPPTGFRSGQQIRGEVNDDNAYVLGQFCSHAGLFARVDQLGAMILELLKSGLEEVVQEGLKTRQQEQRFILGWDRVQDPQKTLAGSGVSCNTIGHLGFTGTSVWLDLEKKRGCLILTNATQHYSYDRGSLNELRRQLGTLVFSL